MVNNSTTKRSVDLCVGLDVIIVGIMDAMAGTTAVAVDADVVITTDAVEEIPSVKASARDTGRATMMHCGGCGGSRDGGGCGGPGGGCGGSGCGGGRDGGCGGPDGGCGGCN